MKKSTSYILGVDEAGRGPLAGPVVAAAVILPTTIENELIRDSKKLTEKQRLKAKNIIINNAIDWSFAVVDPKTIDEINILNATFLAMTKAIAQINGKYDKILIDGNKFPYKKLNGVPIECIVKGDSKFVQISAASIIAKTIRDKIMEDLHSYFPQYNWKKNKGYPTKEHRNAIKKHGITPYHRKSFRLFPVEQLSLFG